MQTVETVVRVGHVLICCFPDAKDKAHPQCNQVAIVDVTNTKVSGLTTIPSSLQNAGVWTLAANLLTPCRCCFPEIVTRPKGGQRFPEKEHQLRTQVSTEFCHCFSRLGATLLH